MNEGARHTVSGTRTTSGDGTAVIDAPGADYQVVIYDGSLTQTDPGNDPVTVTIKTGGSRLHRVALLSDVYGVGRLPQLIGTANGAITVSLSAEADVEYTLSYSLRSIVTGLEK